MDGRQPFRGKMLRCAKLQESGLWLYIWYWPTASCHQRSLMRNYLCIVFVQRCIWASADETHPPSTLSLWEGRVYNSKLSWQYLYSMRYAGLLFRISVTWQLSGVVQVPCRCLDSCQKWCRYPAGAPTGVRSGAEIGLLNRRLSVFQGASIGDFTLAPACPIEKGTLWGCSERQRQVQARLFLNEVPWEMPSALIGRLPDYFCQEMRRGFQLEVWLARRAKLL